MFEQDLKSYTGDCLSFYNRWRHITPTYLDRKFKESSADLRDSVEVKNV